MSNTGLNGSGSSKEFEVGPMLAIDTSSAAMTLAIVDGDRVLGEMQSLTERNHSVRLLPELETLMKSSGLSPRDLRAVAVGRGPGSYTGVRIGVTAAKTLAWSLGLPLYAVSSLEALSLGGWRAAAEAAQPSAPAWVVPALDARRGQAFTAIYAVDADGAWTNVRPDAIELFRGYASEQVTHAPGRPGTIVFVVSDEQSFADDIDAAAEGAGVNILRVPHASQARDIAAVARRHGGASRGGG
ncbi:tRNA (adenosine(37)-N6)-threonylcarbamoyltransferase complex dimerization subunit type 1 TsaB, partial [Paenibacillus thermotolerans]